MVAGFIASQPREADPKSVNWSDSITLLPSFQRLHKQDLPRTIGKWFLFYRCLGDQKAAAGETKRLVAKGFPYWSAGGDSLYSPSPLESFSTGSVKD
ncbi:unnamed protein product [Caretta caretta]